MAETGISHKVKDRGRISATTYGDRNSTHTSESSPTVAELTTEETVLLRYSDTAWENNKSQHEIMSNFQEYGTERLIQLLDKLKQQESEDTEKFTKYVAKAIKEMEEREKEIKIKQNEKKMTKKDIKRKKRERKIEIKERDLEIKRFKKEITERDTGKQKGEREKEMKKRDIEIHNIETKMKEIDEEINKNEIEKDRKKRDIEIKIRGKEKEMTDREEIKTDIKKKICLMETDRKYKHNRDQQLKGNIRVFCRVRPLLDHEKQENNCNINHITFPDPNKIEVVTTSNAILKEKQKRKTFSFDRVFKHNATQYQVFEEISDLVQSALDGYNVCIIAYGQTGSGKTYTMEGNSSNDDDKNRGIIHRAVLQIFNTIRMLERIGWKYNVDASCLEIYGKEINDLLCKNKVYQKYEIRHFNNEVRVTNITTEQVNTEQEVYLLLQRISAHRAIAETKSNERSSRSHSVFTLKLSGENSITTETSRSTLKLVDLAGSERIKISRVEGQQMKEALFINQSITTLGRVIRAIRNKEKAIPYRESKLTFLLQNSLGGNSKTLMFVNVSPKEDCVEETFNSLTFATDANQCKKEVSQQNE